MDKDYNFETDTKLFKILFENGWFGEVWAADKSTALVLSLIHI